MRAWILLGLAAGCGFGCQPGTAQEPVVPARQITIVVPFAAGGPSDAMARLIAQGLGEVTGGRVLVENSPGAGGTTASARVARAEPEGHTLVFGNIGTHAANVGLYARLPYDPVADFEPVAIVATVPFVLAVRTGLPARTFTEFRALARSRPGTLNYASAGIGSASHLACLLLDASLGARAQHVPYRGVGPALNDLVAGQVDVMCDQTVTMLPQVTSGAVRGLATLSAKRLPELPDLPSVAEFDLAGAEVEAWNAIFAPRGTPPDVVARLFDLVRKAEDSPAIRARLQSLGATVPAREDAGPAALRTLVKRETSRWSDVLRAAGVVPQ